MNDLERFGAALLAQWRAEGGNDGDPIGIDVLLDRTLPYRTARRLLGIDSSEDYEALVMRLIAGDQHLVATTPEEAGEMARATMASKLPDLDTLRLLRSAAVAFTPAAAARLGDAAFGGARAEADAKWRRTGDNGPASGDADAPDNEPAPPATVIPLPTARDATRVAPTDSPPEPAPAYLTAAVAFSPPGDSCWSCGDELPAGRAVKFCPFCGSDQRPPACATCGTMVERNWRHCPECGHKLKDEG